MTDEPWEVIHGNSLDVLKTLPNESVNCCVTSPPYYALRDYDTGKWVGGDPQCNHIANPKATKEQGNPIYNENRPSRSNTYMKGYFKSICPKCGAIRIDEQIGLEETPEQYIQKLVDVFHEVKRILKNDGTLWVNIGDSYWGSGSRGFDFTNTFTEKSKVQQGSKGTIDLHNIPSLVGNNGTYKNKDLIGIPWMLAFALRADGWYLRQDIIWAKPNCMPESVKDRCTKSHEYIFLFSKQPYYYFDTDSIRTPLAESSKMRVEYKWDCDTPSSGGVHTEKMGNRFANELGANKRDVWYVSVNGGYNDGDNAHYATFPVKLIEPCIRAGSPLGGVVLDPFSGTATTGAASLQLARRYIGIDLSEKYVEMSRKRLQRISDQSNLFDLM